MAGRHFDTVVVGGGPAGAATARALALAGAGSVLVVDAAAAPADVRIGESVPPDVQDVLRRLGLFEAFRSAGHAPCYGSVSLWGDDRRGYNDFLLNPQGHGWHLDRPGFDAFLLQAAERAGASVQRGRRLVDARDTDAGVRLQVSDDAGRTHTVEAGLAVDATGLRADLARRLGARPVVDDRLICLWAVGPAPADLPQPGLTRLQAASYGWWYAAGLPDRRAVVSLTADAGTIRELGLNRPAVWRERARDARLIAAFCADWGAAAVRRDPAPSARLPDPIGRHWLAVGDAALAFDPLMSDGLRKALASGVAAAQVIDRLRAGDATARAAYRRHMERQYARYWAERSAFYDLERRWSDAPFWRRRRACRPAGTHGTDLRSAAAAAAD